MASSVVNIGKLMRKNAYVWSGKKKRMLRVSKFAIKQYASMVECILENQMNLMCGHVVSDKRATIGEDDVVWAWSFSVQYVKVE